MLIHPVDTVTGLPDGVARLFDRIKLGGQRVYQAATAPGQSLIFGETGTSEAQVQALVQNPQYSLSVLTALAMGIQRLQGVPGRDAVVIFAAAAQTQDEVRFVAGAVNMLACYHESVAPIAQVSAKDLRMG